MDSKILKRAKALLAMAQDASSEHEAMIAAKRLHAILAKHNMSVDALEDRPEEIDEEGFESINWPWKRWVLASVAKLYFCECYFSQTRKNYASYFLVGTETNRLFASLIIQNIFKVIENTAKAESKKVQGKIDFTYVTSFRNGAGARIVTRCDELVEAAKQGTLENEDGVMLPALVHIYNTHHILNKEWLSTNKILTRKRATTRAFDAQGYADGQKAGDKVQLNRSLQADASPKLITR